MTNYKLDKTLRMKLDEIEVEAVNSHENLKKAKEALRMLNSDYDDLITYTTEGNNDYSSIHMIAEIVTDYVQIAMKHIVMWIRCWWQSSRIQIKIKQHGG